MTELKFDVKGNTYTIHVPTVGDMVDVERLKMALSNGFYNEMMRTITVSAQEALTAIDIQACFSVLCPRLLEDLKCSDIKRMSVEDYAELKQAYEKQYLPWWNIWLQLFKGTEDVKK